MSFARDNTMRFARDNILSKMSGPGDASLQPGDILFRWVPPGINQRNWVQDLISKKQRTQQETHRRAEQDESAVALSWALVEHVGIYTDCGVLEIGKGGLKRNPVERRENYDLVVRAPSFGPGISALATSAVPDKRQRVYPLVDLWNLSRRVTLGYDGATAVMNDLIRSDRANREAGKANVLKQAVVCSHFVHAVLYAAATSGTMRTATDHRWDHIFKISPSHMWTEFLKKRGLWLQLAAWYVGLQHRGEVYRTIDHRKLGVGLLLPPVNPKVGRRPLR